MRVARVFGLNPLARPRRTSEAEAYPQQRRTPQADQPVQGRQGPVQDRDRARYVADRLRRVLPAHDVCRQADAGPQTDAGHRSDEPGVSRQNGLTSGGLSRAGGSAEKGAGHLHRKWRSGRPDFRYRASYRGDAGETRHRLRPDARV